MGNRKINSAIHNPNSALNYYPSKFKKTCSIADVSKYNKDHELFLCGRLLELNDLEKRGILSDESGEIDLQFKENQTNIGEGDIVQASGYLDSKNIFLVGSFTKLVPGQVSKVNKEERSHSRWRELLNNRHQQEILRFRSAFLHTSRDFFLQQGFVEMDAATLVPAAGMEPHIEPFITHLKRPEGELKQFYLHTSPEFAMKKMLVAGFEKIFFLGHVFRNNENTEIHSPEFTMLEWYRAYEDYTTLMDDCKELVYFLKNRLKPEWSHVWRRDDLLVRDWQTRSLTTIMMSKCGLDLRRIKEKDQEELLKSIRKNGIFDGDKSWPIDDLFFLLYINLVEPELGKDLPIIIKDYPLWMASMAKRKEDDPDFVERFELYIDGIELANGFTELNDPDEQLERLRKEQKQRQVMKRSQVPIDLDFIESLKAGMPPAAGIALGLDRLMMVCCGLNEIKELLTYSF